MADRIRYAASALPIVTVDGDNSPAKDFVHEDVGKALGGSAEYTIADTWDVSMAYSLTTSNADIDDIFSNTTSATYFLCIQNLDSTANVLMSLDSGSNFDIVIPPGMVFACEFDSITVAALIL